MKYHGFLAALLLILGQRAYAQSDAKIPDPDPEIERKSFIVAEGFEVNLFAADPLLAKPIQMNFDSAGRLWVACSEVYPHIKPGEQANDKIVILEDTKGTGHADKVTIFADGLLIPTGVEPGDGGAYIANSTELLHLSASKPGGKADRRRIVLSGFGTEDTHHILHTIRWGPDGMLYFNQSTYIHSHIETPYGIRRLNGGGVWQYRPETEHLEVFLRGFINPWGHEFDRFGQSFLTDGANGEGITHGIPGAAYSWAIGVNRILHGVNPGSPKHCGLEILSGTHLPEDWRGNLLTNDFRGHRVCRFVLKEDGSTFASQEKPELIKTNHPAFRPIDVKMGPDGAIYIADWYNPIIQHGEIDFRDPRRDHAHGRIWRVTARNRTLIKNPNLDKASVPELLDALRSLEDWTRHQAKRVLKEKGAKEVLPVLKQWISKLDREKVESEHHALEGLWVYQSLDHVEPALLVSLLRANDFHVRAAATRVLSHWHDRISHSLELLGALVVDENPRVRLEAVRALAQIKNARAIEIAMSALDRPVDRVLDYALWMTAKDLEPYWMPAFQSGKLNFGGNARHLSFALESVGNASGIQPVLRLLESKALTADREQGLWLLLARVGGPEELGKVLEHANESSKDLQDQLVKAVEQSVQQRHVGQPRNIKSLNGLLATKEIPTRAAAARIAGYWKIEPLRTALEAIANSVKASSAERQAAFDGLTELGGMKSKVFFEQLAAKSNDVSTKCFAISALASIDLSAAADQARVLLTSATPNEELLSLYTAFLNRKGGVKALAKALDATKLPGDVAKLGIRAVRSSVQDAPELVAALNKAGDLAAQKHDLTQKELQELSADVIKQGNPERGEALYRRADMQCLKCHAIGGAGGQVGPDLASIGTSAPVDYLIESILLPNKAVKEGYHAARIETLDGKVHLGIKVRETKTEVVLRTADDKELVVPVKDIEEKRDSRSLMPDGLADSLTRGELLDLVRFLSELGKIGPYSLSKARVIRRWEALQPTPAGMDLIRKARIAVTAENDPIFQWNSIFSKVSGEVPLDAAPKMVIWMDSPPLAIVRCHLDVTTGGKIKLKLNSSTGLSLHVGTTPVDSRQETIVDLKPGVQTLLFAIDLSKRTEPLRCEIEDVMDSQARVSVIGGK